jgi:hypothetical protein
MNHPQHQIPGRIYKSQHRYQVGFTSHSTDTR